MVDKKMVESSNSGIYADYLSSFILKDINEDLAQDFLEKNPASISYI